MSRPIQDRICEFIASRGAEGVDSVELARLYLAPSSSPTLLCEKLLAAALAGDPRVHRREDGRWAANQASTNPAAETRFAVIEATCANAGARAYPLEWACVILDRAGRSVEKKRAAIRPDPWPQGLITPPYLREFLRNGRTLPEAVAAAIEYIGNATVVSFEMGPFQMAISKRLLDEGRAAPALSLQKLSRSLRGGPAKSIEALASLAGVNVREPANAGDRALFTAEILAALLASPDKAGLGNPADWIERQHPKKWDADFSRYEFDRDFVENVPETPGIYVMRDANGAAIYVGKASNLKRRVKSYFKSRFEVDEKTERIVESLSRLEIQETGSDLAAMQAEYRAIRDLQPPINVQFDVHERPAAAKGPQKRLILVLPSPQPESAELFLIDGNRDMRRVVVPRTDAASARQAIQEFFFDKKSVPAQPQADSEEIQIAWSWIERNTDHANGFDVDLAGGLEGTMRLLEQYLAEGNANGKVIHV